MEHSIEWWNSCGRDLWDGLRLKTYPLAVRFYEKTEDAPDGLRRPKRDLGKPMAFCQAVSRARMSGQKLLMTKEDHWCWNPLLAYGMVEFDEGGKAFDILKRVMGMPVEKAAAFLKTFPRLEQGKYQAVAIAPLQDSPFVPDVVLIYSDTRQLDRMLMVTKSVTGGRIASEFDPIDSCNYELVVPMQTGEYRITVPDPGEMQRAHAGTDEMIFSIPACRMQEFIDGFRAMTARQKLYETTPDLLYEFEHPAFYDALFELWGLDTSKEWRKET